MSTPHMTDLLYPKSMDGLSGRAPNVVAEAARLRAQRFELIAFNCLTCIRCIDIGYVDIGYYWILEIFYI